MCIYANNTIGITFDMKTWSLKFGDVAAYTQRTNGAHSMDNPTLEAFYDGFQDYLVDAGTPYCDVVSILVALAIAEGRVNPRLFQDPGYCDDIRGDRRYIDIPIQGGEDFVVALPVATTRVPLECECTLATWRRTASAPGAARAATEFHGPELYGALAQIVGTCGEEFTRQRDLQRSCCLSRTLTIRQQLLTLLRKHGVRFFTPHMMRAGFVGACLPWPSSLLICGTCMFLIRMHSCAVDAFLRARTRGRGFNLEAWWLEVSVLGIWKCAFNARTYIASVYHVPVSDDICRAVRWDLVKRMWDMRVNAASNPNQGKAGALDIVCVCACIDCTYICNSSLSSRCYRYARDAFFLNSSLYDITSELFLREREVDMLVAQRQAYGDEFVDSNIVNARAHLVDGLKQRLEHACTHAIKFIDGHDICFGDVNVDVLRVPPQVIANRVMASGIVDIRLRPAMAHAFLLFAALSRVSRAPNNLGIRGFPGPINALKVAFKRGDGSWKEWTQQMLAKNDIGYAIKLRQRIVG